MGKHKLFLDFGLPWRFELGIHFNHKNPHHSQVMGFWGNPKPVRHPNNLHSTANAKFNDMAILKEDPTTSPFIWTWPGN